MRDKVPSGRENGHHLMHIYRDHLHLLYVYLDLAHTLPRYGFALSISFSFFCYIALAYLTKSTMNKNMFDFVSVCKGTCAHCFYLCSHCLLTKLFAAAMNISIETLIQKHHNIMYEYYTCEWHASEPVSM